MKRCSRVSVLTATLAGISVGQPFPAWTIGTYSVNKYSDNGGGGDLSKQVLMALNFFEKGEATLRLAYPNTGGGQPFHTELWDYKDFEVTRDAVIGRNQPAPYLRETAHFVYFGGHGYRAHPSGHPTSSLYLGGNEKKYGEVTPDSLPMGTGNNRWFMAHSCVLFPITPTSSGSATAQSVWAPSFQGLKAMLAFESFVPEYSDGAELFDNFWAYYIEYKWGLWESFYQAQFDEGYDHLGAGLHPSCLSAAGQDYCDEKFEQTNLDPAGSPGEVDAYHTQSMGVPSYPRLP